MSALRPDGQSRPVIEIDSNASNDYIESMAVLTIRNLPDEIRNRLRVRASRNGRSMEAEARAIIAGAVNAPAPQTLQETIAKVQAWAAGAQRKSRPAGKGAKPQGGGVKSFLRDRRREAIREAIQDGFNPRDLYRSDFARIASEADWTTDYIDQLAKKSIKP